jgi:replicative superfamily II helicase
MPHRLTISKNLMLDRDHLDPDLISKIRFRFSYDNPKFLENQRLGFSNYSTPQIIKVYHENGAGISFPRGLVKDLFEILPDFSVEDRTATRPVDLPVSRISLRPYQEKAVAAMVLRNQGILHAPPGSGKTVTAIDLILKQGQKTLILVHTKDLLQQWKDRFKAFTGIDAGAVGDSGVDIKAVTVGMVQSLNAKKLPKSFYHGFGCVVLDECHHAPAY